MGAACSTQRRDENSYKILVGKSERKNHSEDLGVDGRIILEWILQKQSGKVWTGLIWLRIKDKLRVLVGTVMNLRRHKRWGISLLAEQLSVSQEGLCFLELLFTGKSNLNPRVRGAHCTSEALSVSRRGLTSLAHLHIMWNSRIGMSPKTLLECIYVHGWAADSCSIMNTRCAMRHS
jgi:hypothetical protein